MTAYTCGFERLETPTSRSTWSTAKMLLTIKIEDSQGSIRPAKEYGRGKPALFQNCHHSDIPLHIDLRTTRIQPDHRTGSWSALHPAHRTSNDICRVPCISLIRLLRLQRLSHATARSQIIGLNIGSCVSRLLKARTWRR